MSNRSANKEFWSTKDGLSISKSRSSRGLPSRDFHDVLRAELDIISRKQDNGDQIARAHDKQLVGLAFSGGGIRSATFNLGVLQSLARMKLLSRFNYLSTVSGGGYIGSWLMAWIKRRETHTDMPPGAVASQTSPEPMCSVGTSAEASDSMKAVARDLIPEWVNQSGRKEPPEIHFLRRFSNYLTPKLGWLGADTWTLVAVYLRNLLLNLIVLTAAFTFVLLVPRLITFGSQQLFSSVPFWILRNVVLLALGIASFCIMSAMRYFIRARPRKNPGPFSLNAIAQRTKLNWLKRGLRNLAARKSEIESNSVILPEISEWARIAGIAWYPSKLFDHDFILRLKFEIKKAGDRDVYIWMPIKGGKLVGDVADTAVKILLSAEEAINPSGQFRTGAINAQLPVRRAEIRAGENELKVICTEDSCAVYVNDLNLNTIQVRREKPRGLRRWQRILRGRAFLAIGVQTDETSVSIKSITVKKVETPADTGSTQGQVQRRIIVPLFIAAFLATYVFRFGVLGGLGEAGSNPAVPWVWSKCAAVSGLVAAGLVLVLRILQKSWSVIVAFSSIIGRSLTRLLERFFTPVLPPRRRWPVRGDNSEWREVLREIVSMGFAGAIGGLILRALYDLFSEKTFSEKHLKYVTTLGTPTVIVAFLATIIFYIGFMGRAMQDERREWWGRLSAWLLIYSSGWVAVFGLAFYAPDVLRQATKHAPIWLGSISIGWIFSTLSGLIAARSATTGTEKSNKLVELVAKVAPYIFVIGFFVSLSWAVDSLIPHIPTSFGAFELLGKLKTLALRSRLTNVLGPFLAVFEFFLKLAAAFRLHLINELWPPFVAAIISGTIALVLSWRLDINQFSMHLLYRNRLGRCYLGASNRLRRAQPFTGFSADDDLMLSDLADLPFGDRTDSAPYPILSAALNLVGGKELAWQQRKAASFMFSPLYCGYDFPELPPGYCPTKEFANRPPPAITLATAMAISGAAASPNMGYHTSPAPAFLMTVFNVRLGWWLGNPRHERGYKKSGPLNVLWRLTCELFGLTSEEGKYIYLSDGGHFENLGIYELVRRRCRFILACDAEEDHAFRFGGLGNAIEKCRSDFGIDIDIDLEPIRRRSEKGYSQWHCAIGRIFYSRVDEYGRDGLLVYLKSSLTGDEPTDALRYAAANPEFPHQTTADQWFDESQFESYRVLGYHITQNVFLPLGDAEQVSALRNEELFVGLSQHWYPPSASTAESFTKHTNAIIAIYDELRTNKHLQFLNCDIYPEWRVLFDEKPPAVPGLAFERREISRKQLPKSDDDLRAGFYICTAVCDLFEAVYVDLHLEQEFDHPDNRGWMNFFRHWSAAPMFRISWAIGGSNYGARFQSFCERHLNLKLGRCRRCVIEPEKLRDLPETIDWTPETEKIAKKIVEAIWIWLGTSKVGPEVIAKAALTVANELPRAERGCVLDDNAETKARALIEMELSRIKGEGQFSKKKADYKDEEWYAAATLVEFLKRGIPEKQFKTNWTAIVAELALVHGATIASRVLNPVFQTELNPVERELIELFLIFHPRLAASAQIIRLKITPETMLEVSSNGEEDIREEDIYFPVGFAVLAQTGWPPSANEAHKLVALRIQDHLRSKGLGRIALKTLICAYPNLEIDLKRMHPQASEVPTDKDYGRLSRLFHSVKIELAEEKCA